MNKKLSVFYAFDLQRFADPVQGSKIIYLLRVLSKATEKAADVLAFQTEGSTSRSKDADTTATKDGTVRTPGALEVEHSLTALMAKGDPTIEELEQAQENDDPVEVWKVNLAEKGTGEDANKFRAEYSRGYLTNIEVTGNSEDFAELSLTIGVYQKPKKGYATLSVEQQEAAEYAFEDVTKKTAG
ncbi:phage major tail protein, TP901-1 family [Faecalibaculum rodentium]|uniref:phage major tail protein, TP901-1 family n=1 Tax=Faecalibaculum rodentium TaxID=1702221 RepID=UPI0023F47C15|nr:phage major tail protein, TP901-1 family [Faecalibaculum rodentium]